MSTDDAWRRCEGTWDRLKWARGQKFKTGKDAAAAFAMKEDTYRAYERRPDSSKHTPLDPDHAAQFARRLGVRWEWLLRGQGEPFLPDQNLARILDAYEHVPPERRVAVAAAIEQLLKAT
jgi:hypothetical protein